MGLNQEVQISPEFRRSNNLANEAKDVLEMFDDRYIRFNTVHGQTYRATLWHARRFAIASCLKNGMTKLCSSLFLRIDRSFVKHCFCYRLSK